MAGDPAKKGAVIGGCCFVLLLISGGLVGCSFSTLDYHHVGIDFDATSQSINEDRLFTNGRHFLGLAHSFFDYPTYLHTVEFSDSEDGQDMAAWKSGPLSAGSKDGQAIELELSFFVRIDTSETANVINLYKTFRQNYMNTVMSRAQDAVKGTTVRFETLEFFTNRTDIAAAIHASLQEKLSDMSMNVHSVQLRGITLSANFEQAIIDKIVSAQADKTAIQDGLARQETAETGVVVADADRQITELTAGAVANSVVRTGTASAEAAQLKIEADSTALEQLKGDLNLNNAQLLQYLWTQTLRDDTNSKLLIGLGNNPAIVST